MVSTLSEIRKGQYYRIQYKSVNDGNPIVLQVEDRDEWWISFYPVNGNTVKLQNNMGDVHEEPFIRIAKIAITNNTTEVSLTRVYKKDLPLAVLEMV